MLLIIDLNPNDMSCMYSTLCLIEQHSLRLNMPTACVTFNQPLWLKAVEIVHGCNMNVVSHLGTFHNEFLGKHWYKYGRFWVRGGSSMLLWIWDSCTDADRKTVLRAVLGHIIAESSLVVCCHVTLFK